MDPVDPDPDSEHCSLVFQLELDQEEGPEPLCRSISSAHLAERKMETRSAA